MINETRVGYRTLAELLNFEKENIEELYRLKDYPSLVYHIEKYNGLKKEYDK